jgi:hypothetical protein
MIKKLKIAIVSLISIALFAVPVMVPAMAHADTIQNGLCGGASLSTTPADCASSTTGSTSKIQGIITTTITIFSWVVGIASVIMIIIGGMRYIISGGESGNVQGAKNTILYSIIGLVVVALAQFIVQFVLNKATQNPTT